MNYLLIAITAYLLNAVSVTIDKILLVKKLPNPALYVFYISVFSLAALLLIPFTTFPGLQAFGTASFSTILWTLGAYFMFKALKSGEAARVIPIIGTLIPVILLLMSAVSGSVNTNEIWAVIILVAGLLFLIFPYLKGKFSKEELLLELVSALLFANSYFLLKTAYNGADFLSIFVYSKLILVPIILTILLLPFLRRIIFSGSGHDKPVNLYSKTGMILFIGQAAGGASQMLLTFAISLASPAVINSIQGIQYVFLFILSLSLSKKFPAAFGEKFSRLNLTGKIIGILLIFFGLWILSFSEVQTSKPTLGVTFSPRYAQELGLNPDEVFTAILTELNPQIIRLPVYWDEVEKEKGIYDFTVTDKYLEALNSKGTEVVLVVGFKQPRWPECFQPLWSKSQQDSEFNNSILDLVKNEVSHFKKYPNIKYWQVENEPFLDFGICPKPNHKRVTEEIQIVRSLDPRPILMTDSGELSTWYPIMGLGDIFGTTLYRNVWNPWFGIIEYPWPPMFYSMKSQLAQFISGSSGKPSIIAELQAEPWPAEKKSLGQISIAEQQKLFSTSQMIENVDYARQTGFKEVYLWGVEWWYYMKLNTDSGYWQAARQLFSKRSL
jgi:hypothetical protein